MISDRQLQYWIDFLAEQIVALEALHLVATEEPHLASPELVAFLQMNDAIVKEQVERAVAEFVQRNIWPSWLTPDQIVNLAHRATMAHGLLIMILNGQFLHADTLQIPKSRDRSKFLQWLFIDLWRYGGVPYLDALTNSYFADDPKAKKRPS